MLQELRNVRELHIADLRERACAAIEDYVDVLRTAGEPADRVVMAIKELGRHAGFPVATGVRTPSAYSVHELLMAEVVACAIRRYFHETK